jgi:hypothetical protein
MGLFGLLAHPKIFRDLLAPIPIEREEKSWVYLRDCEFVRVE